MLKTSMQRNLSAPTVRPLLERIIVPHLYALLLLLAFSGFASASDIELHGFSGIFASEAGTAKPKGITISFHEEDDGTLSGVIIRPDGEFKMEEVAVQESTARGRLEPLPGSTAYYSFFAQLDEERTVMQVTFYYHATKRAQPFQLEAPHIVFKSEE